MIAYSLLAFLGAYALFLLGFAVFMYFENRKFGDNQFTVKLLPPPRRLDPPAVAAAAAADVASPMPDWSAVPERSSRLGARPGGAATWAPTR